MWKTLAPSHLFFMRCFGSTYMNTEGAEMFLEGFIIILESPLRSSVSKWRSVMFSILPVIRIGPYNGTDALVCLRGVEVRKCSLCSLRNTIQLSTSIVNLNFNSCGLSVAQFISGTLMCIVDKGIFSDASRPPRRNLLRLHLSLLQSFSP